MKSFISAKKTGELFLFSLFIGAINLIFPQNPGFFNGFFNPYLFVSLIVAAYYGKYYGFLNIFFSALMILLPLPWVLDLMHPGTWARAYWIGLGSPALIVLAAALVGVYVLGLIRDSYQSRLSHTKERLRDISRDKGLLLRQSRVLTRVNHELEERIAQQQDPVSVLYNQVQELNALNLENALEAVLETVQKYSGATSASIWELDQEEKSLRLRANVGWETRKDTRTEIPVEETIEGWVLRNDILYSVKMLLQYDNLRKMDTGRNLITLPIYAGTTVWGVLNIEDMPFIKYNNYTEKLLQMIVALAGPALQRSLEFEAVVKQGEVNEYTGLPAFPEFFSLLQQTMQRLSLEQGTLSVFLLELINFDDLAAKFSRERVFGLLLQMSEALTTLSQNRGSFFHYKDDNQLALILPHMDFDGASMFSLETLGLVNEKEWTLNDQPVNLEIVLGYAALGEQEISPDELLQVAENILEMQKI
jgi:GGDEF domain-containing protein